MLTGKPLSIAVSGHRFLSEPDRLRDSVDLALSRLAEFFPRRPFRVLSSLAEGADRLVAERILARPDSELVAVLPLSKELYIADFAEAGSKQEFLALLARAIQVIEIEPRRTRDESYESAGEYILSHCEVLFAVWDGLPAQGRGGTGALVERARTKGLPLVWVHSGNRVPGSSQPTSLGAAQGKLTFEGLYGIVDP